MENLSERRAELLDAIVDSLLAEGAADLSLRPLAERVGTSARLLIYHFGTKEALLDAALAAVRRRITTALAALAADRQPADLGARLAMFWDWATAEANQGYFRLLFEADGLTMFNRTRAVTDEARRDSLGIWLSLIGRAAQSAPVDTTLVLGAMNGLLQDFFSTGDRIRTTAALRTLIDTFIPEAAAPAPSARPPS